jgi:prephenate dehydrogenase
MVVVMQEHASQEQIQRVIDRLVSNGFDVHRSTGESHTVLGAVGVHPDYDPRDIEVLEGVREVVRITKPRKPRKQAAQPVEVSPFHRVAVIGTGLVGGSFALALRAHFREVSIVGFDRVPVVERAMARGIVLEAAEDIAAAVRGADLIYIALPIAAAVDMLPAIAASAGADALVTDACSTKAVVCGAARKCFRDGARFLGGHPMAGQESSGAENADGDLFRGSPYALIGAEDESDPRVAAFARVLRAMGAKPVWCDAETHDWAVGIVSHLPQLLSVALARVVSDETDETGLPVSLAGRGLRDSLRLAGSSYDIWRDVCLTNTQNISRALDRLGQAVEHLRTHLTSRELQAEFAGANELYKILNKVK